MDLPELLELGARWLEQDPDEITRRQLRELLDQSRSDSQAQEELKDCFAGSLQFGTAGLRGQMGPGPNRMNRVTVMRAAAGLGNYLLSQGQHGKRIVIGYDGRHFSRQFAIDSAEVLSGLNFEVHLFAVVVPTPVLAYSIKPLAACAGVMVTASHNPASDNGYKVYLGDGRQIVPPADQEIAKQISQVGDVRNLLKSSDYETTTQELIDQYVRRIAQLVSTGPVEPSALKAVQFVYTAMHGVGWDTFSHVLALSGFRGVISVSSQQEPNPDFPTVEFPNPEEPGALDLAIETAIENSAQVILANDPDADRLAVALPDTSGNWQRLKGDQVGMLLGWWLIERSRLQGQTVAGTFANSIVSSTQLADLAKSSGLKFETTLTGFKWVSRVPNLIYGYEEALGYCVDPESVSDKDGISAAVIFLELVAYLNTLSKTVWQLLDELALQFGFNVTDQISVRISDLSEVKSVMTELRQKGHTNLGNFAVAKFVDLELGECLPATEGLIFELAPFDDIRWARIIVRPSGTEPKIKCYLEVMCANSDLNLAKQQSHQALAKLAEAVEPFLTGGSK